MSQFSGPHITVQACNYKKYQMIFLQQNLKYWKHKAIYNLHLIWDAKFDKELATFPVQCSNLHVKANNIKLNANILFWMLSLFLYNDQKKSQQKINKLHAIDWLAHHFGKQRTNSVYCFSKVIPSPQTLTFFPSNILLKWQLYCGTYQLCSVTIWHHLVATGLLY